MSDVFRLADCEGEFATRADGARVRSRLVELYEEAAKGQILKIDFSRVDVMTPSFADECFGKLAERIGADNFRATVSLVGANDTIRALVNSVLAERLSAARRPHG